MTLVFHQAALGDFVLTFPLLRGLKPPVTVISSWSKSLLAEKAIPGMTPMSIELFEFTRLYAPGGPTALSPAVREVFEGVTAVVSFVARAGESWADNVARLAPKAKIAFVEPRPNEASDWKGHVEDWHLLQLREQGFDLTPAPPVRHIPGDGAVVVHAGSGGLDKCWPSDRFEQLIDTLRHDGREVRPVLGEAEAERWPPDLLQRWRETLGAKVPTDLIALHDLLATASLYIGNDSGPTHLAAQLGVPTVALFGPSDPARWAPRGPHVTVLAPPKPQPMSWLTPDRVLAPARERLLP